MQTLYVFVDEYGDPSLDTTKTGVSRTYIQCAVCVWDKDIVNVTTAADGLRLRKFQSGEMKSSGIGSNDERRISILRKLASLDAFVIAFCAQKDKVRSDTGLQFKKSFIKFFAKKMYERLSLYSENMIVVVDKHGRSQFMEEFGAYLNAKFPSDLFQGASFEFRDSKDEVLLQVADVYAGSLARLHDEGKASEQAGRIEHAMRDRVSLTLWPRGSEPLPGALPETGEHDERIRRFCVRAVERYLTTHAAGDDRDQVARSAFLEILLSSHAWGGQADYVSTKILRREIGQVIGEPISEHRFRSAVVAKLRDSDLVIASCAKGYKIPACYADIRDYAAFASTIIPPMVARVARARKGIREATLGAVDVLDEISLRELKSLVDALQ